MKNTSRLNLCQIFYPLLLVVFYIHATYRWKFLYKSFDTFSFLNISSKTLVSFGYIGGLVSLILAILFFDSRIVRFIAVVFCALLSTLLMSSQTGVIGYSPAVLCLILLFYPGTERINDSSNHFFLKLLIGSISLLTVVEVIVDLANGRNFHRLLMSSHTLPEVDGLRAFALSAQEQAGLFLVPVAFVFLVNKVLLPVSLFKQRWQMICLLILLIELFLSSMFPNGARVGWALILATTSLIVVFGNHQQNTIDDELK